jgi:hypothetical protein
MKKIILKIAKKKYRALVLFLLSLIAIISPLCPLEPEPESSIVLSAKDLTITDEKLNTVLADVESDLTSPEFVDNHRALFETCEKLSRENYFKQKNFKKFDGLFGDTACHIRALMITLGVMDAPEYCDLRTLSYLFTILPKINIDTNGVIHRRMNSAGTLEKINELVSSIHENICTSKSQVTKLIDNSDKLASILSVDFLRQCVGGTGFLQECVKCSDFTSTCIDGVTGVNTILTPEDTRTLEQSLRYIFSAQGRYVNLFYPWRKMLCSVCAC